MTDLPQSLPQAWRPPMGWNSWDSYGTTLTEDELLANARFMAEPDVYLEVQHPCWSCNSNSSSANASAGVR